MSSDTMLHSPLGTVLQAQCGDYEREIWHSMQPTLVAEPPIQMVDSLNCNAVLTNNPAAADPFAEYIALLSSDRPWLHEQSSDEDAIGTTNLDLPQRPQQLMATIYEGEGPHFLTIGARNSEVRDSIGDLLNSTSPQATASDLEIASAHAQPPKHDSSIRNRRRQNHSCDQCRSSKRACDLPMSVRIRHKEPSSSCSTCKSRGWECTVVWLAEKKSKEYARRRAKMASYEAGANEAGAEEKRTDRVRPPIRENISTVESDLSRKLDMGEMTLQYFNLYIDVFDMPMSECLLRGSMPPRYIRGIAALAPLSTSENLALCLREANAWVNRCWEANTVPMSWSPNTAAPHAFRTVALLDAVFQYRDNTKSSRKPSSLRVASINDTYKMVAIATAAQFIVGNGQPSSYSREIAATTWRKAREMVFKNMAATNSFRQSLSMTLFGLIIRPNISPDEDNVSETDSVYALCEGIRLLDSLCLKASRQLQTMKENYPYTSGDCTWDLAPDVIENLLELVGAVQWLANLANDVVVGTSRGTICPIPPTQVIDRNTGSPQKYVGSLQQPDITTSPTAIKELDIENSVLSRSPTGGQILMTLEHSSSSYDEVKQAIRDLVPLITLLWKSLAGFMIVAKTIQTGKSDFESIASHYKATMKFVELWRSTFGTFDDKSVLRLQQSPSKIRRTFAFCVNDGDLGVLLFYDTVQSLEKDLAQQPLTPQKRDLCNILDATRRVLKDQRSMSAAQISALASICGRVSSPGFQDNGGLKAYVQDIGAHPRVLFKWVKDAASLVGVQWTYLRIALFDALLAAAFFYLPIPEASDGDLQELAGQREEDNKTKVAGVPVVWLTAGLGVLSQFFYVSGQELFIYNSSSPLIPSHCSTPLSRFLTAFSLLILKPRLDFADLLCWHDRFRCTLHEVDWCDCGHYVYDDLSERGVQHRLRHFITSDRSTHQERVR
ncbi:Pc21g21100 [Aspergillus udagawae]|uniref:Zn(2)-C6 fungal-type domain-containing protein n=1 Tax=Aspergillus udagawae TaxID=91492 RepID=A0ABQ1B082_9EURO|nr:Pc21g21100 [Aspergillus udagawae]GFF90987.1 hypothetical protein IFM53868_06352 [Aspergillus udagawae]